MKTILQLNKRKLKKAPKILKLGKHKIKSSGKKWPYGVKNYDGISTKRKKVASR